METLFTDAETFQKERPTKLTEKQKEDFYKRMAKELKEEGFSSSSIEYIEHDLEELYPFRDNGFEMAKDLEGYGKKGSYEIDVRFCEWLDGLDYEFSEVLDSTVKAWVKAHNPPHIFDKGIKLLINKEINREQKVNEVIFVTGLYESKASYLIHKDANHNGGTIVPYEMIESYCTQIP